jgi:hypothetical protein
VCDEDPEQRPASLAAAPCRTLPVAGVNSLWHRRSPFGVRAPGRSSGAGAFVSIKYS